MSAQRNVAVGSGEVNVNVEVFELLSTGGLPVIWVVGGVRSTVQVYVTGASAPAPLTFTENMCEPSESPVTECGGVQVAGVPASSAQVNDAGPFGSWNVNVAEVWFVNAGGVWSKTTGAVGAATATPGATANTATTTSSARTATPVATALRSTCGSLQSPRVDASLTLISRI